MTLEDMEKVYTNPLMMDNSCRDILQTAINYHMKLFYQPQMEMPMSRLRAGTDCLVIFGAGKTDNQLCTRITAAKVMSKNLCPFEKLEQLKYRRYFAGCAVYNNFVFIIGGQTAMAGDGSHATNSGFRFNPRDGKWLQISSMAHARTHFALVCLPKCIIAIGGKSGRMALSSSERYDFQANEWTHISHLPNTLFSHAGAAYNNKVYISGGCPGEDFTDQLHCFDPDKNQWQLLSPMNHSRGYHVMFTVGAKIFACAGNRHSGNRIDVLDTECYDIETDQWTIVKPSVLGQSEAPSVMADSKLYILGGYSWNSRSFQSSIQCYDIENEVWTVNESHLEEPLTGVVSCYTKLPLSMFEEQEPLYG